MLTIEPLAVDAVFSDHRPHLFRMMDLGEFDQLVALLAVLGESLMPADVEAWHPPKRRPVAVTPPLGILARAQVDATPSAGLAIAGGRAARVELADAPRPTVIEAEGVVDHRPRTSTVTLWHRAGSWFK